MTDVMKFMKGHHQEGSLWLNLSYHEKSVPMTNLKNIIQVGSLSKVHYIRLQNNVISWVWKPTCNKPWSAKKQVDRSQELLIVEKSFCTQFSCKEVGFEGISCRFSEIWTGNRSKTRKNEKKLSPFFRGPHFSEMAYHTISTFGA